MQQKLEIRSTSDGSPTLFLSHLDETYHSMHGALQESMHVFIEHGLKTILKNEIRILEVGLGTALNAALSFRQAAENKRSIYYTAIEPFPINLELSSQLLYGSDIDPVLREIHQAPWETEVKMESGILLKHQLPIAEFDTQERFDLIYYDAFAPAKQAEMWTEERMHQMFSMLNEGGILVTYCANGQFKRNLKAAGFGIQSLPGPPGKREMTVGTKLDARR